MIEILKIILTKVLSQISFSEIRKNRSDKEYGAIGSELMLLYISINRSVYIGQRIIDTLQKMSKLTYYDENDENLGDELFYLAEHQGKELFKIITACNTLHIELGIIDEKGGRILQNLLDIKIGFLNNLICDLWPEIADRDSGMNQLHFYSKMGRGTHNFLRTFNYETMCKLIEEPNLRNYTKEVDSVWRAEAVFPISKKIHPSRAKEYLESGIQNNLDGISTAIQSLKNQIENNFTIKDILLNIHNDRSLLAKPDRTMVRDYDRANSLKYGEQSRVHAKKI